MKPISVSYGDYYHYWPNLRPEPWECCQRLVSPEEYARLESMLAQYAEFQAFLKEIESRPEHDGVAAYFENS